jgi:hypothetical protein
LHLEKYSQEEKERELQRTGALLWRKPKMTERRIMRQRAFRTTIDVNGDELTTVTAPEEREHHGTHHRRWPRPQAAAKQPFYGA